MAKLSAYPQSPRNVLNVYAYLLATRRHGQSVDDGKPKDEDARSSLADPESYYLSEGRYLSQRNALMKMEARILHRLGFQLHVALPYALAINYLQALDTSQDPASGAALSRQTFALLTTALFSPQLLYLTHQPPALATAAIYLAARQLQVSLPLLEWWTVFDVDREELGFLVVAFLSVNAFVLADRRRWSGLTPSASSAGRLPPLTTDELERELDLQKAERGESNDNLDDVQGARDYRGKG